MNTIFETRKCYRCEKPYRPTTKAQKYCGSQKKREGCAWLSSMESAKKWTASNLDKLKEYRVNGTMVDYWSSCPAKLDYLLRWYPHWGAEPLAKELNIPISLIQLKVRQLKLTMLVCRDQRICYYCKIAYIGRHKKFGLRCTRCFKPYRADKRREAIHQNPLQERLRELAQQACARNQKRGDPTKITVEELLCVWERQEGRCAYSGRQMFVSSVYYTKPCPDTLSIDRVDSRRGYSIDNIVLCTWWSNVAKHNLTTYDFVERCRELVRHADSAKRGFKP